MGFASGHIALSPNTNSFFISGRPYESIAEYAIPDIVNSTNLEDLAFTGEPLQDFSNFSESPSFTTEYNDIRNIGGMELVGDKLIVSVFDPYDAASASGFDVDNFFIIEDAYNLESSEVTGYFQMEDKMFAAGWLSPMPPHLQEELGGDYFAGSARQASINARWSTEPSGYSLNINEFLETDAGGLAENTTFQRYTFNDSLHEHSTNYIRQTTGTYTSPFTLEEQENCPEFYTDNTKWKQECVLDNDLWTDTSEAFYGAIIHGTNTYLSLGILSGAASGISYKNTPIDGRGQCPGHCPHIWTDRDNYIWLFDVQDMIDVKNGLSNPYDARPYEYGAIKLPFDDLNEDGVISYITGADYDPASNRLFIAMGRADPFQDFESTAVILVYDIALNRPLPPLLMPNR